MCFPEAKTNFGESTSAKEEPKEPPVAGEGGESGDTGERSTENAPEDGKTEVDGEAAEGETSGKSGTNEQGKKKKKKDAAKKVEWVLNSEHECEPMLSNH